MINYIVYGNTDYLDVLNIQTDYMESRGDLTLLINSNDLQLDELYSKYNKVIFYDNTDTYATRLLTSLEQVTADYFLFIHDIDILLNVDDEHIKKFYDFLVYNNFDRIDLKHTDNIEHFLLINANKNLAINEWAQVNKKNLNEGVYLVKQDDPKDYIYNVNPSIWKRKSFLELLSNFKEKNYRNIEGLDVQIFTAKFNIFKLYSNTKLECGYFNCLDIFTFLHISHSGKFLPLNNEFKSVYGQPYNDVSQEYIKIVNKYNLKKSNKWIN
jgi:hypothetical protein